MRPIDADVLHAKISEENRRNYAATENVAQILLRIETAPTIEAEPMRHGQWIAVSSFEACGGDEEVWMAHGNPIAYHYCSECKNETYLNEEGKEILSDYCPFCGAKMDVIDTNVDNKESTNNDSFKNGG